MSRPQIIVNVTGALPRRGTPTETGTAFLVYAGASGPAAPVVCLTPGQATAAAAPDPIAAWVGDALEQGAPEVVLLRAAATDPAAVTQPEWATALAKLTKDFGPGQVCIPGVATSNAYAALLAHAAAFTNRTVLLDAAATGVVPSALAATAAGLHAAPGAERAGLVGGTTQVPGPGGTTRTVPASLVAAGLAARGDSAVGHTNHAPIYDQSRDAGLVRRGTGVTQVFSDADADTLYDVGVNLVRLVDGRPTLTGWRSLSDQTVFRQLNIGRLAMQLTSGLSGVMLRFLGRQVDGKGLLFAEVEGALRGELLRLYTLGALYGANADAAFDADCSFANNPAGPGSDLADGKIHAAAVASASPHTEQLTIDVVTAIAEGVAA